MGKWEGLICLTDSDKTSFPACVFMATMHNNEFAVLYHLCAFSLINMQNKCCTDQLII